MANIFFKLMHQSADSNILINMEEEQIANLLNTKLQHAFESCKFTDESCTLLPFYDSVIPDQQKNLLGEVRVSVMIEEKVRGINMRSLKE